MSESLQYRRPCIHAGATPSCPCGDFEVRRLDNRWLALGAGRGGPVWGLGRVDRRPHVAVVFSPPFAAWWKGVRSRKKRRTIGGTRESNPTSQDSPTSKQGGGVSKGDAE